MRSTEPDRDGFADAVDHWRKRLTLPDFNDVIKGVNERLAARAPIELEQDGRLLYWRIRRYNGAVKFIARCVPDGPWSRWMRAASALFKVCMAVAVLGALALGAVGIVAVIDRAIEFAMSYQPSAPSGFEIPPLTVETLQEMAREVALTAVAVVIALASLLLAVAIVIPMYHALLLVFLPGLVLHELGHAIAVIKHGGEIESVGLLFCGPFVMGAFVEPKDNSTHGFEHNQIREVYAAGIIHNLALACVFAVAALLVPTEGLRHILVGLAALEGLNALLNALPYPKLDGGHYLADVLSEWWGFDPVLPRGWWSE